VTTGNFSLSRGEGHALGTISLKGYVEMMMLGQVGSEEGRDAALVKVRNRNGIVCRFAELYVV
jgi:ribonuclease P/MRP protein subunit POP1